MAQIGSLQLENQQLTIFQHLDNPELSNTIDLYDGIPYPVFDPKDQQRPFVEREFTHKKQQYQLTITPAQLKTKDNTIKKVYPGEREELVEQALRKLACEGQIRVYEKQAGVQFTLYQLQQELKAYKHTASIVQIKEALEICRRTAIDLVWEVGGRKSQSFGNLFHDMGLVTKADWNASGKESHAYVVFHPLVTKSIIENSFRQINYVRYMKLKNYLSRWVYRKMSHNFIQADWKSSQYTLSLNTIVQGSGISLYDSIPNTIRRVRRSLDQLAKNDIITDYETTPKKDGRRISGAVFALHPSKSFTDDAIGSNITSRSHRWSKLADQLEQ
jgi:hypothetical protein